MYVCIYLSIYLYIYMSKNVRTTPSAPSQLSCFGVSVIRLVFDSMSPVTTLRSTALSSKVNLPHAVNFRA